MRQNQQPNARAEQANAVNMFGTIFSCEVSQYKGSHKRNEIIKGTQRPYQQLSLPEHGAGGINGVE